MILSVSHFIRTFSSNSDEKRNMIFSLFSTSKSLLNVPGNCLHMGMNDFERMIMGKIACAFHIIATL